MLRKIPSLSTCGSPSGWTCPWSLRRRAMFLSKILSWIHAEAWNELLWHICHCELSLLPSYEWTWSLSLCSFLISFFKSSSYFSFWLVLDALCTFCQVSSNFSTPSATFFRHRSISAGVGKSQVRVDTVEGSPQHGPAQYRVKSNHFFYQELASAGYFQPPFSLSYLEVF